MWVLYPGCGYLGQQSMGALFGHIMRVLRDPSPFQIDRILIHYKLDQVTSHPRWGLGFSVYGFFWLKAEETSDVDRISRRNATRADFNSYLGSTVDFDKNRNHLPGSLTKNGPAHEVPLIPNLWVELGKLRDQEKVIWIKWLVLQRDGRKVTHTYRLVKKLFQVQHIPNFVFHDFRHFAVTNWADAVLMRN